MAFLTNASKINTVERCQLDQGLCRDCSQSSQPHFFTIRHLIISRAATKIAVMTINVKLETMT